MEEKALNILIVSYHFPPEWAGPAERFLRYVPGFKKRNIALHFITRKHGDQQCDKTQHRGATVIRIKAKPGKYNFESFLLNAGHYAYRHRKNYDLVLYMSYNYASIPYNLLLRWKGKPTIALHTMAVNYAGWGLKAKLIKWLSVAGLRSHQYAISSTQYLKANIASVGFPENSILVISNGVDLNRFQPPRNKKEKQEVKKTLNLNGSFNALFVGLKSPRKGVLPLVRGWKMYKEKYRGKGNLILVGPERRENSALASFYSEWDEEVRDAERYDIYLRGSASNIEDYFKACDLFAFLSDLEGLPNVLPEAMACGIPILMNAYEGFSDEVATPGHQVYLTDRNPGQIAADLSRLIEDSDKLQQLSQNALQWIREKHDVEMSLDKFAGFFKELSR